MSLLHKVKYRLSHLGTGNRFKSGHEVLLCINHICSQIQNLAVRSEILYTVLIFFKHTFIPLF